jgi:hypothetical protein
MRRNATQIALIRAGKEIATKFATTKGGNCQPANRTINK